MCRYRRFGGTCCPSLQEDGIVSTWTLQIGVKRSFEASVSTPSLRGVKSQKSVIWFWKRLLTSKGRKSRGLLMRRSATLNFAPVVQCRCSVSRIRLAFFWHPFFFFFNFCTGIDYANRYFWEFISTSLTKGGSAINARYTIYIWARSLFTACRIWFTAT